MTREEYAALSARLDALDEVFEGLREKMDAVEADIAVTKRRVSGPGRAG